MKACGGCCSMTCPTTSFLATGETHSIEESSNSPSARSAWTTGGRTSSRTPHSCDPRKSTSSSVTPQKRSPCSAGNGRSTSPAGRNSWCGMTSNSRTHGRVNRRFVAVTGVDGFVGRHLARRARAQGMSVVGVSRSSTPPVEIADLLEDYVSADLRDRWPLSLPPGAVVIHLAGLAAVGPSFADPQRYITSNSQMVTNLCEWLIERDRRDVRVLGISTGAVYEATADGCGQSETDALSFSSPYVVTRCSSRVNSPITGRGGWTPSLRARSTTSALVRFRFSRPRPDSSARCSGAWSSIEGWRPRYSAGLHGRARRRFGVSPHSPTPRDARPHLQRGVGSVSVWPRDPRDDLRGSRTRCART